MKKELSFDNIAPLQQKKNGTRNMGENIEKKGTPKTGTCANWSAGYKMWPFAFSLYLYLIIEGKNSYKTTFTFKCKIIIYDTLWYGWGYFVLSL